MKLTIENIEKFFNLLNEIRGDDFFNLYQRTIFTKEEIEKFEGTYNTEMGKEEFAKYNSYNYLKQNYCLIVQEYRKAYNISIDAKEVEVFNNKIKEEYLYIDKISNEINKMVKGFSKGKEQEKMQKTLSSRRVRLQEIIKKDNTNFLNTIIELGMCKAKLKKELCVDPDKLLLKDAFIRYFKLVINEICSG